MKSIHVCYGFPPDPVGGTEVYVAALARELTRLGDVAIVTAPAEQTTSYSWEGLTVRRFSFEEARDTAELYGEGDMVAAAHFDKLLEQERPDIVHVHALTHACSLRLVRVAKRRAPVIFTYHTPAVSCARGSLMEGGESRCDGALEPKRCAACVLQQHGVPTVLARAATLIPVAATKRLPAAILANRVGTALQLPHLMAWRQRAFRALMSEVDRVVALCEWTEQLLRVNGVPAERIVRMGQAFCQTPRRLAAPSSHDTLRLLFMGRLHPDKGLDVILDALEQMHDPNVSLSVYGTPQGREGRALGERLERLAARDTRLHVHPPVAPESVPEVIADHDLMLVPSQGFETGPLVVLEAFAAGVPVLGSALGGIAELVRDGIDGVLVGPFNAPSAWASAIARLNQNRGSIHRLRSGVTAPPLMASTAVAVKDMYEQVVCGPRRRELLPA